MIDRPVVVLIGTEARRVSDIAALAAEAEAFERFGRDEGIASVCAEAAVFWTEAGEPVKAESLLQLVVGNGLHGVARDVDFLLTITSIVRVAATLGLDDVTAAGATLLEPYAGRAVVNAGAVTFHGLVDEYLYRAGRSLGRDDANQWRHVAVSTYRRLGATWWLGQLTDPFPADVDQPRSVPTSLDRAMTRRWLFRHQPTGTWSIGVESRYATFPDRRGLHYLRELLTHPGVEISCLELSERIEGHAATGVWQGDLGDVLDAKAKAAYRRRLDELNADIAEAEDWRDTGRRERAETERQALLDQLAAATGLGGRRRRIGAHDERARVAVRKAIASAITNLEQHDPAIARILRTTIRTGTACCYEPNPDAPVEWIVE
jgi:hypothetical protein